MRARRSSRTTRSRLRLHDGEEPLCDTSKESTAKSPRLRVALTELDRNVPPELELENLLQKDSTSFEDESSQDALCEPSSQTTQYNSQESECGECAVPAYW